jgi:hypothetical protein
MSGRWSIMVNHRFFPLRPESKRGPKQTGCGAIMICAAGFRLIAGDACGPANFLTKASMSISLISSLLTTGLVGAKSHLSGTREPATRRRQAHLSSLSFFELSISGWRRPGRAWRAWRQV